MTRARYTTNLVDWKQVEDSIFDDIIKPTQSKKFKKFEKFQKTSINLENFKKFGMLIFKMSKCYSETCE